MTHRASRDNHTAEWTPKQTAEGRTDRTLSERKTLGRHPPPPPPPSARTVRKFPNGFFQLGNEQTVTGQPASMGGTPVANPGHLPLQADQGNRLCVSVCVRLLPYSQCVCVRVRARACISRCMRVLAICVSLRVCSGCGMVVRVCAACVRACVSMWWNGAIIRVPACEMRCNVV